MWNFILLDLYVYVLDDNGFYKIFEYFINFVKIILIGFLNMKLLFLY